MARISRYVKDTVLTGEDILIGSDYDGKVTKNYTLSAMLAWFESEATFSSSTVTFTQDVAATTWNVTHTLSKFPSVTVVDSSNNVVIGEITYNSDSLITLTFASAFSGKAYLN
ncbi:MAG: hypothetical protein ACPGU9_09270 [Flavobacteriaceae bacterium]